MIVISKITSYFAMTRASWKDNLLLLGYEIWHRIASLRRPVQILNCTAILMQCLLLAGCAAPRLAGIYLFSFGLAAATDITTGFSRLELRVGYFCMCARLDDTASWTCGDPGRVREQLMGVTEPWNLVKTAYDLRDGAISPLMNIIFLAFTALAVFLVSSFPLVKVGYETPLAPATTPHPLTMKLFTRTFGLLPLAAMIASLLAAVWQHIAAATAAPLMNALSSGAVMAVSGSAATVLAWLTFIVSLTAGSLCLRTSSVMYSRQLEDDDLYSLPSSYHSTSEFGGRRPSSSTDTSSSSEEYEPPTATSDIRMASLSPREES
ncbi:Ca2+ regulator and membrane fusion protein Fig1-domain-containing protein [Apodospora peruviana]|uniref:Ca2+ regulator and membrane fusion protein Fig1-domain-containing protein n=1 Tax=Apodospora peruviana TaxID=516989 RepID=A0AAE0M0H2_9PEZI|nr:Ca2+ regulator and membrane fusion protein Fig1-domain-containing protein [Apodospora peruviana]